MSIYLRPQARRQAASLSEGHEKHANYTLFTEWSRTCELCYICQFWLSDDQASSDVGNKTEVISCALCIQL